MRYSTVIVAAAAMLLGAGTAQAEKKPKDPNKVVCKTDSYVGSRISKRICKTQAEWDLARSDAQGALDRRGRVMEPPPKPGG